jgi:flagellar hook-associated protein 2
VTLLSIYNVNPYSSTLRITGLATGLDTDQIVSDLMKVERIPYDRLYQSKQLAEWKRDAYREITSLLAGFKSEFFDYLRPATNMLSQATYKQFNIQVVDSITGQASTVVKVDAASGAFEGAHTIRVVELATADKAVSNHAVSKAVEGTPVDLSLSGKTIRINLDGVIKEIELDDYSDMGDLVNKAGTGLQALIDDAFGQGKVVVSSDGSTIRFETTGGATKITLLSGTEDDALDELGIASGASNRINTGLTLEALAERFSIPLSFDGNDQIVFTINQAEFTFDKTDTLNKVINAINSDAKANVTVTYDEVTDKFTIVSKVTGAGDNIILSQAGGNFFEAIGISVENPVTDEGMDAQVVLDGETLVRSSNTFTVNGITYTLLKKSANTQEVSLKADVDAVYEKVVAFVDKYNELIDFINGKLTEKYDKDYQPLTQEQKEAMSEEEIKLWEERAKSGLLRNDPLLQNIVYSLRKALYDPVEGVGISLYSIGITTGTWETKGRLVIDEARLKEAIKNSPDTVMQLFTKSSEISYTDWEERGARYAEVGLAQRMYDIIQDNIRTTRDENGNKGYLLMKAGMKGDASEFSNAMYTSIVETERRMDTLLDQLIEKENRYYLQYAALERAIGQMNAQMNWLMAQLGAWQQ